MQISSQVKMYMYTILSCLVIILHSSTSLPAKNLKPKSVDLAYSCLKVTTGGAKSNDETPILLIHGVASSKESWMGIYQLLAMRTNRRVCIADLRNHGDSPWNDEISMDAMAEDLKRLLDILKIPKVILLGHSLGGKVSMHFTLNYPDKVQKLIVEDMRPNGVTDEATAGVKFFLTLVQSALNVIPAGANEGVARKAVGKFLKEQLAKANAGVMDEKVIDFLPITCSDGQCRWKTNTKLIGQLLNNVGALIMDESSGRFDGPTLFVYGIQSPFKIKDDESSIKKLFPQAELVGVEGAGHLVHIHREFLDAVIKFINTED